MKLSLDHRVAVPEGILFRNIDGESVLVSLTSGVYFGLDEVGTRMWELVVQHGTLAPVVDAIVAEYDVGAQRAHDDLIALVDELLARGLLKADTD